MPIHSSSPGVYIEETSAGARTIAGVSTSITLFLGQAVDGPVDRPVHCLSFKGFEDSFISDQSVSELSLSVELFFLNGGTECYVMRVDTADYGAAYDKLDKTPDLFNLMVLCANAAGPAMETLWEEASAFCKKKRALVLMDPPDSWHTVGEILDPATGVSSLRTGMALQNSAIFFPRLEVSRNGASRFAGPAGAIAGVMARMDAARGVWKAPAGMEADLRGIVGIQHHLTDGENGSLNMEGVNVIRVFSSSIVNWGARTMDGYDHAASEYKYIPVRRMALFIEESLCRGLQWVAFEPNGEPLWAQIRETVGAFMNGLFRQGAFRGATQKEAYFVACDSSTATQNDIDKGVVNIGVGFAPLKPSEFVIISLCQLTAGA
jgi:phage tail sheath protein FI